MGYKYSKKPAARKGKGGYRRRPAKGGYAKSTSKSLDKYVEAKVKRAVKQASRGPPRSVPVQLIPAHFDRNHQVPKVQVQEQWTSYFEGPSSVRKYAILPISELIPTQRPVAGEADDRFQSLHTVFVKGVSLRMTVNHAEGVRLLVFAFRNGMRRDVTPSSGTRPFVDRATISDPPVKGRPVSEVVFDVMSKEQLMGMDGSGGYPLRNLEVHNGPFAVVPRMNGNFEWKATDSSAFTSRFSKGEGRPIGTIYGKPDGAASKAHGATFNAMFRGNRTRQVKLYIKFNQVVIEGYCDWLTFWIHRTYNIAPKS